MLLWQLALGVGILLLWQGASGRLIDNFFISNPVDVGQRTRLTGGFSENIKNQQSTTDFGVFLALTRRF